METCQSGKPCTLCCKLLAIEMLQKPRYKWCQFCDTGNGCTIYDQRPEECGAYTCLWLETQLQGFGMIPKLKPCICGVIFDTSTSDKQNLVAHVNEGIDWRQGEVGDFIRKISYEATVLIREKDRVTVVRNNRIAGSEVCFTGSEFSIAKYNIAAIPIHLRKVAVP